MKSLALIFLPIAFAWIDRWWGAPRRKTHAKVLAGVTLLALFLADWRVGSVGLAVVVGRSLGFADGVATGENRFGLLARSAFPMLAAWGLTAFDWHAPAYLAPHAIATMALALWYGARVRKYPDEPFQALDDNEALELTRGAIAGLCIALYAVVERF